jgi:hypothetical protein
MWVEFRSQRGVLNTTLCEKVSQWLAAGRWFSSGTPISSTNKTVCHDITEILFEVAFNIINIIGPLVSCFQRFLIYLGFQSFDWAYMIKIFTETCRVTSILNWMFTFLLLNSLSSLPCAYMCISIDSNFLRSCELWDSKIRLHSWKEPVLREEYDNFNSHALHMSVDCRSLLGIYYMIFILFIKF